MTAPNRSRSLRVEVRMSVDERCILDQLAEETGLSASDVIRMLIRGRTLAVQPSVVPASVPAPEPPVAVQLSAAEPVDLHSPTGPALVNTGDGVPLRRRRPCDGKQVAVRFEGELDPGAKKFTSLAAALRGK